MVYGRSRESDHAAEDQRRVEANAMLASNPIQLGDFTQAFFKITDQPTDHDPTIAGPQLDFAKLIDSQNRVATDASFVQLAHINFPFVDNIQKGFAGQLDEWHGSDVSNEKS